MGASNAGGLALCAASGCMLESNDDAVLRQALALRRWRHQRGTMPSAPMTRPAVKEINTKTISGVFHTFPKKKCATTSCSLFSAKVKRVKKMAAFSVHRSSHKNSCIVCAVWLTWCTDSIGTHGWPCQFPITTCSLHAARLFWRLPLRAGLCPV